MSDMEGFGKNKETDIAKEQENAALESAAVNFGSYINEFFNEGDKRLTEINEQERRQMSSAIENLGTVGDFEMEDLKGETEKKLEELDTESVSVIEQARQEVDAVVVEQKDGVQIESEGLQKPEVQEKNEPRNPELEKTPAWQFEQRQKSLEVQGLITSGRDPKEVAKSIEALSNRDKYNRLLPKVLEKYKNAYETVAKYKESNISPQELFKKLFGVEPKGIVTVTYNPIDIVFSLEDSSDYARAIYEENEPSAAQLEKGKYDGGSVARGGSIPKELNGKVILIPKGNEQLLKTDLGNILEHERQHVSNGLYDETRYHDLPKTVLLKDIASAPPETKKDTILAYLRSERKYADNGKMHDELVAHYKGLDLKSKDEVGKKVVANLVISYREKFYKYKIDSCRRELEKVGVDSPMIEECLTESFENESWQMIRDASYSLRDLEDAGLTKDQAINLVQMEPLARWSEVAKQFIEQKNKETA